MPEIAPWENPNLPAPFATTEREIEGRTRHFALWQWDERLVWRDLDYSRLWWATLDETATLADWERAVGSWRFGRASSQSCNFGGSGQRIGISNSVRFFNLQYGSNALRFHVINNATGRGLAREIVAGDWHPFDYSGRAQMKRILLRKHRRTQNVCTPLLWRPDVTFPKASDALLDGYKKTLLGQIPPQLMVLLEQGDHARPFLLLRSLFLWNIHLAHKLERVTFVTSQILAHFGLPENSILKVVESRAHQTRKLLFSVSVEGTNWSVRANLPTIPSQHEALEAALYLKQELRPILTAAEIEEILTPPARL